MTSDVTTARKDNVRDKEDPTERKTNRLTQNQHTYNTRHI